MYCFCLVAPRFIDVPQSVESFIDTAVNLSCSADGFPAPDITWTFQGMPFTNETVNSSNSTYTESTIVITNLLLSHGGSYSCHIESAAAVMSSSNSANVTVIGGKITKLHSMAIANYLVICIKIMYNVWLNF